MSDRSFLFFTDLYNVAIKNSPKDPVTGAVQNKTDVNYQINTYDANDPYKVVNTENKTATYTTTQSILNEDQFINYKGNSKTNDFLPYTGTPDVNENISLTEIIEWTQQNHPSMKLNYGNFAFLDDFGKYPANRLMILRRYGSGVPDDLFSHQSKPLYTMATYYDLDNSPVDISFKEKWITFDDTFLSVLEDVIGIKLESVPGVGGALSAIKSNPLAQDILQKVAQSLGVQTAGDNIYGDPNLIYEAKIREADAEGIKSGLEADITIKFEAKFVQREIGGVDAEAAFMMIVAEAVHMGTSNSRHLITKGAGAALNSFIKSLNSGDVGDFFGKVVESIADLLSKAIEKLEKLASNVVEAATTGNASLIGDALLNEVKDLIKSRYQRYRWKLIGAVGAMSGIPTAPWHVSIGNPKNPWFVCGNMYIDNCILEFGGELGYNDSPTELTVKYTIKNGRALGADEITSLFNSGKGRIYDTIDKLQTVNVPNNNSTIKLPGNPSQNNTNSNGINNNETGVTAEDNNEVVDTAQTNDLETAGAPTTDLANGTQEEDKNVPKADETSNSGYVYTLNSQGPNKWYVVRYKGKEVYTGRKSFSLTEAELLSEAKAAVGDDGNNDDV